MMKPTLLLASTLALASALHATPAAIDSRITAVTVFQDRAEVTRVAELTAGTGVQTFRFDGLPASIQPNSLRIGGSGGFTLVDLKYDSRLVSEQPGERLRELTEQRETLERSILAEDLHLKRLDDEAAYIHAVAARFTTVPKEGPAPEINPDGWRSLLTFQQEELKRIDAAKIESGDALKQLREDLRRVNEEINKLGSAREKRVYFADAQIETKADGPVRLNLRYVVYGAGWTPAYDLRADSSSATLGLTYFGEVSQSTGEDWSDVQLRLSTAKPMIGGRPPELQPWFLRFFDPVLYRAKSTARSFRDEADLMVQAMPAPAEAGAPMELREASVESGATAVTFAVDQASTVPADGSRTRVVLTQAGFPAHFRYSAVPKLNPYAYLKAEATNGTDFPLLPGRAAVFLDDSFVAETNLDLIAPAEAFEVFLGIDEGIVVERRLVTDLGDTSGLIKNKRKLRYAYVFELTNNKQEVVELVLWDQIPKTTDDSLKIELVQPQIRSNDASIKINDQNFIEWLFTIKPGRTAEARLEYTVEYPEDKQVIGLP